MTIASKLLQVKNSIDSIRQAIETKGGNPNVNLSTLHQEITNLPSGGDSLDVTNSVTVTSKAKGNISKGDVVRREVVNQGDYVPLGDMPFDYSSNASVHNMHPVFSKDYSKFLLSPSQSSARVYGQIEGYIGYASAFSSLAQGTSARCFSEDGNLVYTVTNVLYASTTISYRSLSQLNTVLGTYTFSVGTNYTVIAITNDYPNSRLLVFSRYQNQVHVQSVPLNVDGSFARVYSTISSPNPTHTTTYPSSGVFYYNADLGYAVVSGMLLSITVFGVTKVAEVSASYIVSYDGTRLITTNASIYSSMSIYEIVKEGSDLSLNLIITTDYSDIDNFEGDESVEVRITSVNLTGGEFIVSVRGNSALSINRVHHLRFDGENITTYQVLYSGTSDSPFWVLFFTATNAILYIPSTTATMLVASEGVDTVERLNKITDIRFTNDLGIAKSDAVGGDSVEVMLILHNQTDTT